MLAPTLALALTLAASEPERPPSVIVLISSQEGLSARDVAELTDAFSRALEAAGIPLAVDALPTRVMARDVSACQRNPTCLIAIARRWSAARVVAVEAARLLDEVAVVVDLLDGRDGRSLLQRNVMLKGKRLAKTHLQLEPLARDLRAVPVQHARPTASSGAIATAATTASAGRPGDAPVRTDLQPSPNPPVTTLPATTAPRALAPAIATGIGAGVGAGVAVTFLVLGLGEKAQLDRARRVEGLGNGGSAYLLDEATARATAARANQDFTIALTSAAIAAGLGLASAALAH